MRIQIFRDALLPNDLNQSEASVYLLKVYDLTILAIKR